jgi:hypothetical protein
MGKRQRHVQALAKNLLKLWTFAEVADVEPPTTLPSGPARRRDPGETTVYNTLVGARTARRERS